MSKIKERLKSKVVWVTAIPLIANLICTIAGENVSVQFNEIGTTLITLLALFGILNNPDNKEEF